VIHYMVKISLVENHDNFKILFTALHDWDVLDWDRSRWYQDIANYLTCLRCPKLRSYSRWYQDIVNYLMWSRNPKSRQCLSTSLVFILSLVCACVRASTWVCAYACECMRVWGCECVHVRAYVCECVHVRMCVFVFFLSHQKMTLL